MFINELTKGTELNIEIIGSDDLKFTFTSAITEVKSSADARFISRLQDKLNHIPLVVINKLEYEGKTLIFEGSKFICKVSTTYNGKTYLWESVRIAKLDLPSKDCKHCIISQENSSPINQRSEYRQYIGLKGIVKIGDSRAVREIVVRDVSHSGVGFVISGAVDILQGDHVIISWHDTGFNKHRKELVDLLYKVEAKVVRVTPMPNDRNMVGCLLDDTYPMVEKYLMAKQREELRKNKARD